MTVEIRPIEQDEVEAYARAAHLGFLDSGPLPPERAERFQRRFQPGRFWSAVDGGRVVATLRSADFDTTLPSANGATVSTAGLTAVTVTATHRRQGIMSKMMHGDMASSVERGEPLATLIAAEWPIYGRFGFAPAVDNATFELDASIARWRVEGEGSVEVVDVDTLRAEAPAVFDLHRLRSPGEITRDPLTWDAYAQITPFEGPWKGFQVLCRDGGGTVTGYAQYEIDKHFEGRRPKGKLKLVELVASTTGAAICLWRYLCGIDWVSTIVAEDRSVADPLPYWLEDGRAARVTARNDFVWARPLDVPACLTARSYVGTGRTVVEVVDPMTYCSGRYELDVTGEGACCTRTEAAAELTMPVGTLGALLFGGASLHQLEGAGLVDEHRAGTVARVDTLFRWPVTPWSVTWF